MTHMHKRLRLEVEVTLDDERTFLSSIINVTEDMVEIHDENRAHIWIKRSKIKKCMYKGKDLTKEAPPDEEPEITPFRRMSTPFYIGEDTAK